MKQLLDRLLGRRPKLAARDAAALRSDAKVNIERIRSANLSYCGPPKLENLLDAALRVRAEGVAGDFLEAGVALGGSAILLAKLKAPWVDLHLYDVFSMIPSPGLGDGEDAHKRYEVIRSGASAGIGGDLYYGYVDKLIDRVKANLAIFDLEPKRDNIHLIQGLFDDTLHPRGPIALAHIDCDWYEPVRTCINRILPHLSPGGILVFDDYSSYSGCTKAVNEMLDERPEMEKIFHHRSLGVRLIRN